MEVAHQYTKKRRDFGHPCYFEDVVAKEFATVPTSHEYDMDYAVRSPTITTIDTAPLMAQHDVNTDRVTRRHQGMRHVEGGWPENVDATEADQVDRFMKRLTKDPRFRTGVQALGGVVETSVRQNNTVDVYEKYFEGLDIAHLSTDPPSARGLAVFRDPSPVKRTATSVNWHPEGGKIAVAYSLLRFQDPRILGLDGAGRLPCSSYLWDILAPNTPLAELTPPSPLVCLRYNVKTPDILVGGSYNGMVHVFDVRKPRSPAITSSPIDRSHHDPVYEVQWVQSKTNSQFASTSTDGRVLWWDTRKLSEPTDELLLTDASGRVLGGRCLEYNIEAGPAKYLVGTEQGQVLLANMKKKGGGGGGGKGGDASMITPLDSVKHHGPIVSIQRNAAHPGMAFMTIGDWGVRIWSEKSRGFTLMQMPYSDSVLTAGCWSPTRAGVFYVARQDGVLDVWDLLYRHSAPCYSHRVSDQPLSAVACQGSQMSGGGRLLAVGDMNGTVTLLEVSEGLATQQPGEKSAMLNVFDREAKREENLEKRAKDLARLARQAAAAKAESAGAAAEELSPSGLTAAEEEILRKVDADFLALVRSGEGEGEEAPRGAAAGGGGGGKEGEGEGKGE